MAAGGALSLAGWCWAVAVTAGFLAHEPLLVLLGQRGPRVRRELGDAARRRITWLAGFAVAGAVGFFLLAESEARWSPAPAAGLVLLVLPFVWRGKEKTLAGELLVGFALAAAAAPALVAAGRPEAGIVAACVWSLAVTLSTVTVRALVAQQRVDGVVPARWVAGGLAAAILGAGLYLGQERLLPSLVVLAPVPIAFVALHLVLRPPPARELKKVGWALAVCFVLCTGLLVAGLLLT